MNKNERPLSAKIFQFPTRRGGLSGPVAAERRLDHVRAEPTKTIHWDAWYHQEAIVEDRTGRA